MLRKFYVHNFKTLLNFTFEPKGINLLIGRNNVGKTNLCQAMHFLSLTARARVLNACALSAGMAPSFTNRYFAEERTDFACQCELSLNGKRYLFDYRVTLEFPESPDAAGRPAVIAETLDVSGGGIANRRLLNREGSNVHIVDEAHPEGAGVTIDLGSKLPGDTTGLRLVERASPSSQLAGAFKSYLESWASYDLEDNRLRSTTLKALETRLARDGSNLASAIHALKMGDDRAYRELLSTVRIVEPEADAINFPASPDPNQVFMAFQDAEGRRFLPQELSNGTLRFLAMACILAGNRENAQRHKPPGLILIEEPETGIFVGHLKDLFERIDPSGAEGQYVFTSHSPYFIDFFDSHLDGVFLLRRERTHTVLVQPDKEVTRKLITEFSLGELHFREMLR